MIRINLWKFGGRGSSSGGGAGGGSGVSAGGTGNGYGSSDNKSSDNDSRLETDTINFHKSQSMTGAPPKTSGSKETQEQIEKRITDDRGNVKTIENGQRYNIYTVNGDEEKSYYDKASASETREILEGYSYDEKSGTFKGRSGRASFRVKLVRKKK